MSAKLLILCLGLKSFFNSLEIYEATVTFTWIKSCRFIFQVHHQQSQFVLISWKSSISSSLSWMITRFLAFTWKYLQPHPRKAFLYFTTLLTTLWFAQYHLMPQMDYQSLPSFHVLFRYAFLMSTVNPFPQ